ncbi:MAG: class I SAM-dependent methyltransferase [Anaerolineae bacterium]|nr:class I SAM-dependent methyltransferase [Anaerolineae bacterium]
MNTRAQANPYPQNEPGGCQDEDIERVLKLARPSAAGLALDVAAGHSQALASLSAHAQHVMASDISLPVLQAARAHVIGADRSSVSFVQCAIEALPWEDNTFDLVGCFTAAHHFTNVDRFLEEAARVLKPGGSLVIYERLLPEDDRAARYVDAFYRLGDPRHKRAFAEYQWHGMLLNAGLDVAHSEICRRRIRLLSWAEAHGCAGDVIERLQILLTQTPRAVSTFLRPSCSGTVDAEFDQHYAAIVGSKR